MKFDKKFNVKHLVTVSAVALAMIGGGAMLTNANANTNVHAESTTQREMSYLDAVGKRDALQSKRNDAHANYEADKSDPQMLAYDLEYAPERLRGHKQELINRLTPQQRKTIKQLMAFENGKSNYAPSTKDLGGYTPSSTESDKYAEEHTPVPKLPYFLRSNKTINKQAIRNDKKQLSTRKAKRAINNYKHNHKATRYIKHLIQINKDLTKREKNLTRTKSNHKARSTKRNFHRKSLKRIRNHKNKNIKRNRKRSTKRNRNHKHMKRNTHKHTRRNQRNRK